MSLVFTGFLFVVATFSAFHLFFALFVCLFNFISKYLHAIFSWTHYCSNLQVYFEFKLPTIVQQTSSDFAFLWFLKGRVN